MNNRFFAFLAFFLCSSFTIFGQQDDPVLFTVDATPVHVSEFNYIYTKTNANKADFSKTSLNEYLDLYTKFKLKVQQAKKMKLDTIPSLQRELAGYRKQLANSYLVDKEVTERLVNEAYERSKKDVSVSHIMIKLNRAPSPADTLSAYKKIINVKSKLDAGGDFDKLAREFTEDKRTQNLGGKIGYFSALFPKGFYDMETAAYTTPVGQYSNIVRTPIGYHIIKVNDVRDARGEVEIAHIYLPKKDRNSKVVPGVKTLIDSLYTALEGGSNFEEVAKGFSKDGKTAAKGGYIGFIGINKVELAFEDAIFAIPTDGTYTKPFESSTGWHILKRISKKELEVFDIAKRRLQPKIQQDDRHNLAQKTMITRIKKESNFKENKETLRIFVNGLSDEFYEAKWKFRKTDKAVNLFSIGKEDISLNKFGEYCQRNSTRMRMANKKRQNKKEIAQKIYDQYVEEQCMKYEESQLDVKYPEFKSLMREYEEGILLFEATKILVWDKASQDTVGLEAFHAKRKKLYMWKERARVSTYTLQEGSEKMMKKLRKLATKKSPDAVLKKINAKGKILAHSEKTIEKGKNDILDAMPWQVGSLSAVETNKKNKSLNFFKIEEVIAPVPKELKDARGYIIADYQDFLEREWIKELQSSFKVNVNQAVFNSLIR